MIKAIIFDLCGVFINDSGPISKKIESKFHLPADEILPLIKTILKQVRTPGVDSGPLWQPLLDRLNLTYEDFFKLWFEEESINDELLQFAKELKGKGIKLIILSNNFPERTNYYRKKFPELFKVFDEEYFSWETGNVKPNSEAYNQIISKHDYSPEEYIYFDDNNENLVSASKLGIQSHIYENVENTRQIISPQIT